MFENARIKLTAWYLMIIMSVSLLFSFVIYSEMNSELNKFEMMQIRIRQEVTTGMMFSPVPRFVRIDTQRINSVRLRLIATLGFINLAIFGFSGAAGYFLAGRTLRPIKKIVDEQKRFVADASHEFRTPLTSLRTEIEVALRSKKTNIPQYKKILESNLEEVVNLQDLSNNLLELAQNGTTLEKRKMEALSVNEILKIALKKVQPLADKKIVSIKSPSTDVSILGVKEKLVELFVIILDNAIKYSPEKSTVTISINTTSRFIDIEVTDQGNGIAKKDLPHIFDRFYRADSSRSESGFGLGLSIAEKIMNAHNGKISVKETGSTGTTISLQFPNTG